MSYTKFQTKLGFIIYSARQTSNA